MDKNDEAEKALLNALSLEPDNPDFLFAVADHFIKRKAYRKAKKITEKMITLFPENKVGYDMLRFIKNDQSRLKK
jgi:predicted Zn-dependent protease